MASVAEARRSPFSADPHLHKSIPILPSTTSALAPPRDPMDCTPTSTSTMGPPALNGSSFERNGNSQNHKPSHGQLNNGDAGNTSPNGTSTPAVGAAAAAQQPKVVQTAFIHKLYKYASPCAPRVHSRTNATIACLKTKAFNILFLGRARTKASSCPLLANFLRFFRM